MSDSDDDENYCEYGTALDPLDEDCMPRKKPFSLEDQVARDNQGRRRFHGAFTGGFSAGFFNSVGSLEGWSPSTFKSSRANRADKRDQKAEDYMDDEDIGQFGIAPQVLRAKTDFNDTNKKRRRDPPHPSDGPIPGEPALRELLQPARKTVGIKLLRHMGWKPGQGVGPRLTKTEKHRNKLERKRKNTHVYGCSLPKGSETDSNESSGDECSDLLTFAPDDYEPFLCKTKDNCFGIGYSGLMKRPILSSHVNLFEPPSLVLNDKKKKMRISGQAFGVGALEEEDDDIYAQEDMSQYDFSLESVSLTPTAQKLASSGSSFNFAGDVLQGFSLASKPSSLKKFFPPPVLPQCFQAVHVVRKSHFEPLLGRDVNARKAGLQRHALMASDRAAVLGQSEEAPATATQDTRQLADEARKITENLLANSPDVLSQFRPFAGCPDKQSRYEQYLTLLNIGQKERLTHLQPLSMTEWEKEREKSEFEQASKLFRPLTGAMNDRFVSASQPDDTNNPLAVVERLTDANTDLREAAKMKMFGSLTRERDQWQPCSLLCKRFNIPDPVLSGTLPNTSHKRKSRFSVFDFLDASVHNASAVHKADSDQQVVAIQDSAVSEILPVKMEQESEIEMVTELATPEKEEQQTNKVVNKNLEFPDPPEKIDLYKAIFLSSSEESESEDREDITVPEQPNVLAPLANIPSSHLTVKPLALEIPLPQSTERNELRNTSPPRGVFANIDSINTCKRIKPVEVSISAKEEASPVESCLSVLERRKSDGTIPEIEDAFVYGPSLPDAPLKVTTPSTSTNTNFLSSIVTSRKWVEWVEKPKKSSHKSKHEKRSHKKSSKHKKHKSKKHKRHK